MYADDSSLYVAFKPASPSSVSLTVDWIHDCAKAIKG
jgi:hypothetical protein